MLVIMELFKGSNLIDFIERFDNEEKCENYLAEIKLPMAFPVVNVTMLIIGLRKMIIL